MHQILIQLSLYTVLTDSFGLSTEFSLKLYQHCPTVNNHIQAGTKGLLHQVKEGPGDIFRLSYPA